MLGIDLERLFRAPGQISVLRALWKAPAPVTGRQVQQLAGVHNLTATRCLDDLERLGLLQRRAAGRAYLYTLKRTHRLVRHLVDPIFKAEGTAPTRFAGELATALRGQCLSAVVYGSVARGEADSASDVDLLVVVKDDKSAEHFVQKAQPKVEKLVREGWSFMPEVNVKTRSQLVKAWDSPLVRQIRKEGQLVAGSSLEEVRRGRRS
ncbi:MAG: nucleotidyltransferase domain-containing protein [Phycisphaerae bacterium]|nr:nucleotidyltransferase domain-containing protein [Phycisphaerae bacterium]